MLYFASPNTHLFKQDDSAPTPLDETPKRLHLADGRDARLAQITEITPISLHHLLDRLDVLDKPLGYLFPAVLLGGIEVKRSVERLLAATHAIQDGNTLRKCVI